MNHHKGFTIIELIVVVAIVAILAAVVITSVSQYIKKSKDTAFKADMRSAVSYGTVYFGNNGNFNNFCSDSGTQNFFNPMRKMIINLYDDEIYCSDGEYDDDMIPLVSHDCNNSFVIAAYLPSENEPSGSILCMDSSGVNILGDGTNFQQDSNNVCCCAPSGSYGTGYMCR
jgi:prepilin-type N-terminal cleavage/methylation domain-containing protein